MARKKDSSGKQRKRRKTLDDDGFQKPGALMLNNPLIPPEMDEDIDDDLAFDSEDEALYGQFFSNPDSKPASRSKASRKGQSSSANGKGSGNGELPEEEFNAIDRAERRSKKRRRGGKGDGEDDDEEGLYNYHEEGQSSGDDNDGDYIDLSDMFDMAVKAQQKDTTTKKRKTSTRSTDADTGALADRDEDVGARSVAKKRRQAKVTEESESLYGMAAAGVDGGSTSFSSALRTFVKAKDNSSPEEAAIRQRLREAMANKHNLLSTDVEDPVKDRVTRREVRGAVGKNLEKYKTLLRELNTAKHLQFPMKVPDSTPTLSSTAAIAAAADARFGGGASAGVKSDSSSAAGKLAVRMNELLSRAGLSRRQLQGTEGRGTSGETGGDYVPFDERDGDADGHSGGAGEAEDGAPSRSYVAKLKAMLSYENNRRKRFNRIKSKTYRRILRKEKEREKERRQKAFELLHPELARKRLAEKLIKARAEERVTQKHKNTSAWVKHAKRFAAFDADAKDAIDEQHAIHQRLMHKMEQDAGEAHYERYLAGEGDDDDASSEEERVVDELFSSATANAKDGQPTSSPGKSSTSLLWKSVEEGEDGGEGEGEGATRNGALKKARAELGELKFMKVAREREEKEYETQMKALQEDIRRYQSGEDIAAAGSNSDDDEGAKGKGVPTQAKSARGAIPVGRMSFTAGKKDKGPSGLSSGARRGLAAVESIQLKRQGGILANQNTDDDGAREDGNGTADSVKLDQGPSIDGNSADNSAADEEKNEEEEERGEEEVRCLVKRSGDKGPGKAAKKSKAAKKQGAKHSREEDVKGQFAGLRKAEGSSGVGSPATTAAASSRVVIKPVGLSTTVGPTSVASKTGKEGQQEAESGDAEALAGDDLRAHQEYLISRAFAHDDVDEEFLRDKKAQVEAIMKPEDRNDNLPGWGEWGGEDAKLNQRHKEKLEHTGIQRQIEQSFLMKSRADAALEHVIINHDGVELVPDRMTLHMVPRPFSNPQEFARSMRQPLGPEWSSALGFKEGVQPRVEVEKGSSVLPLDISLRGKKRSTTKRRKTDIQSK